MTHRILLSGGGTAGSVTPLLAVHAYLTQQDPSIEWLFVGTDTGPERALAEAANLPFRTVRAGKLRRYWSWKNISDWSNLYQGYRQARELIREWKPTVVVSAGSYVSVPIAWAAKLHRIPVVIHQQDVRPGLANRLMAPAASRITVSFESSLRHFPKSKSIFTGNPVRSEFLHADAARGRELLDLNSRLPVLVVLGGSTGSSALNSLVSTIGYRLVQHWQVVHLTGSARDFVELQDPHYHVVQFLTWQLPHLMAASDLVVSRAGLGVITELGALRRAAIILPMPGTHQEDNAALIDRRHAGLVLQQSGLTSEDLYQAIEALRIDPARRQHYAHNIHQLYQPNALEQLSQVILHA